MPHANIWIRKENWDKWQGLGNEKSDFINSILSENLPKQPKPTQPTHTNSEDEEDTIENQLDNMGLEYARPGVAWSSGQECEVPFSTFNGKIKLG